MERKGSSSWRKAILKLKKLHVRIKNLWNEFLHQLTTKLIRKFDVICLEKLNIKGLAKGFLAKQVHDASWAKFLSLLKYKAEWANKLVIEVNPSGTSQICKDLSVREHQCQDCGLKVDRDVNAARNIKRLGLRHLELN